MSNFTGFKIEKIENDVIWMMFVHKGVEIYKEPLAASIREFTDRSYIGYKADRALFKMNTIEKAFKKELLRS